MIDCDDDFRCFVSEVFEDFFEFHGYQGIKNELSRVSMRIPSNVVQPAVNCIELKDTILKFEPFSLYMVSLHQS